MLLLSTEALCPFGEQGLCLVSDDGALNWKQSKVFLKPFQLILVDQSGKGQETLEIVYSYLFVVKLLRPTRRAGFEDVAMIRFFTKDKPPIDVRALDAATTRQWAEQCDLFWKVVYTKPDLLQKQQLCDKLKIHLLHFHNHCIERYYIVARYLWRSNVGGDRIRQGRLQLVRAANVHENIFLILYQFFISIQDDDRQKQVGFVVLKFSYLVDESPTTFSIYTPRDHYIFQASHETAKLEWLKPIKKFMQLSGNRSTTGPLERLPSNEQPIYSKSLEGRLSLGLISNTGKTVIKLKYSGPWKIGRSHDNEVCLKDRDNFLSRTHCEIQIIDNCPYIMDLGSAWGTYVNGELITKIPLKNGDIINIGSIFITFQVKGFQKIFTPSTPSTPQSPSKALVKS